MFALWFSKLHLRILVLIFCDIKYILCVVIKMDEILYTNFYPDFRSMRPTAAKKEKDRNPYDGLRRWSALTHGLGIVLAVLGTALLLNRCYGQNAMHSCAAFAVYGAALIELYTASTLYHCVNTTIKGRMALKKLDHISIYFLIAGTYTPICLGPLQGLWGHTLLIVIWSLSLLGTVVTLLWIHSPRWVTVGIYLFMGWLAIFAIYPLSRVLAFRGLFWLLLGGILYTVGGILYALKWPGRFNPNFGCHEIFHVFILLGSVCHFMLMYRVIAAI